MLRFTERYNKTTRQWLRLRHSSKVKSNNVPLNSQRKTRFKLSNRIPTGSFIIIFHFIKLHRTDKKRESKHPFKSASERLHRSAWQISILQDLSSAQGQSPLKLKRSRKFSRRHKPTGRRTSFCIETIERTCYYSRQKKNSLASFRIELTDGVTYKAVKQFI